MVSFSLDADKTDFSMRQHSLLLWVVLLVGGVFGANEVPVSVMEGDSVTLISNATKIQKNEELMWKINNGDIIAQIDGETDSFSLPGNKKSFKDRLKLNRTTGSLTITNISANDTRNYILQIDSAIEGEPKIFKVTVNGVPVVDKDGVKSVPVTKGDSVTLRTGFTQIDGVKWKSGNRDLNLTDNQNGDLTINITGNSQRENYVLEINNSRMGLRRTYCMVLNGTVKTETVKEGQDVTLETGLIEIKGYDLILWKNEGVFVAEFNKLTNQVTYNRENNGRLHLNHQSGNLIIRDSRTNDSGYYDLKMSCNTHFLQRTISVTVNMADSGVSPGAVTGIVVGLLVFNWCLQL